MRLNLFAYFGIAILSVTAFFIAALLKLIGRLSIDPYFFITKFSDIKKAKKTIKKYQSKNFPDMENYVKRNIKWTMDPIFGLLDFPQLPITTLLRKKGDCDDFASLYRKILDNRMEHKTFSVIKSFGIGHVMLAIKISDKSYTICSNDDVYTIRANSWEDAYHKAGKKFYGEYICVIKYFNFLTLPIWPVNLPKK